jgi:NAD(P)H dehydrogenase (quinone)
MIAVCGASGQLGRLTVRLLLEHVDAARVVALTRTPHAVAGLGVKCRRADFDDPDTLVRAFDGAERLLLISTGTFDTTGRRIRQHANAVRATARASVGHVVYTSISQAGAPGNPAAVAEDHRLTEAALASSGLPYTVLRNNMYTHLVLMGLDSTLAGGLLLDNFGDGASAYVTREDCAAVAATVLAGGGYLGRRLEVTGPRAHTQAEIAGLLSEYTGVTVRYVPISDDDAVADLVAHGMPEPRARRFATIGASVRAGYTATVTDVVARVTGRPATSVAEFLATRFGVPRRQAPRACHVMAAAQRRRQRGGRWTSRPETSP